MAEVSLSTIVGEFLDLIQGGQAEYARAYRIAMRGLRELEWDVTGENYEDEFAVEYDKTVCLPDDFINLVRIGIINGKGELDPLIENKSLSVFEGRDGYSKSGSMNISSHLSKTVLYSGSLGVGSYPGPGSYRLDRDQKIIILNPDFCHDRVVIMYLRRKKCDGDYVLNELSVTALVSFLDWQWHMNKSGVPSYDKLEKKREWLRQKKLAKSRIKNTTRQVMSQISRQATRQGLKG